MDGLLNFLIDVLEAITLFDFGSDSISVFHHCIFGYRNTKLSDHYGHVDCLVVHSTDLANCNRKTLVSSCR